MQKRGEGPTGPWPGVATGKLENGAVSWGPFPSKVVDRLDKPQICSLHSLAWPQLPQRTGFTQSAWIGLSPPLRFVPLPAFAQGGNKPLLDPSDSSPTPPRMAGALLQGKALTQRRRAGLARRCVTERKRSPTGCRFAQM